MGRHTDWEDEEEDPEAFESEALRYLVDFERPKVLNVLYDAFGDDINNPVGLFIFLWRSRELPDLDPDDPDYETDEEIVNVPTAGKHAAFEWLAQGCP